MDFNLNIQIQGIEKLFCLATCVLFFNKLVTSTAFKYIIYKTVSQFSEDIKPKIIANFLGVENQFQLVEIVWKHLEFDFDSLVISLRAYINVIILINKFIQNHTPVYQIIHSPVC